MGIVRFALRFPHTFYVVAALILFLGVLIGLAIGVLPGLSGIVGLAISVGVNW